MKRLSYILGFLTVALFLLSVGSVAKADAVDPAIGVKGCTGECSTTWTGSTTFTFNCTTSGGCTFDTGGFDLASGMITSFDIHSDTALIFTALFGETVTPSGVPTTDATLSGFTVVPCCAIELALATDTTPTIFSPFQFEIQAADGESGTLIISSPEPGTLILLGTGLSALGLRRLRRKARA
jgi:hypothetical protein